MLGIGEITPGGLGSEFYHCSFLPYHCVSEPVSLAVHMGTTLPLNGLGGG